MKLILILSSALLLFTTSAFAELSAEEFRAILEKP